jgi:hypothetical protein
MSVGGACSAKLELGNIPACGKRQNKIGEICTEIALLEHNPNEMSAS